MSLVFYRETRQQQKPSNSCVQIQTPRPVAEELFGVMPPRKPWETRERWGPQQNRHGPYTEVNLASKKIKPQQARQRLKVQALNQLDAIAEEGLRAINAELNTMAWARN